MIKRNCTTIYLFLFLLSALPPLSSEEKLFFFVDGKKWEVGPSLSSKGKATYELLSNEAASLLETLHIQKSTKTSAPLANMIPPFAENIGKTQTPGSSFLYTVLKESKNRLLFEWQNENSTEKTFGLTYFLRGKENAYAIFYSSKNSQNQKKILLLWRKLFRKAYIAAKQHSDKQENIASLTENGIVIETP